MFNTDGYRFGFNGKEYDGVFKSYDYGARMYKENLGRFLSVDPLTKSYPQETSYSHSGNNPIQFVDYDGGFKWPGDKAEQKIYEARYPMFTKYLKENFTEILKSDRIMNALFKYSVGALTKARIEKDLVYGSGPELRPELRGTFADGHYEPHPQNPELSYIQINADALDRFEDAMKKNSNDLKKQATLLENVETVLHEYTHFGDGLDGLDAILDANMNVINGKESKLDGTRPDNLEEGRAASSEIYGPNNMTVPSPLDLLRVIKLRAEGVEFFDPLKKTQTLNPLEIDKTVLPTVPKQ